MDIGKKYILFFILFLGFLIYQHELVHKTIFEYFKIKSEIRFNFKEFYTTPLNKTTDSCDTFKEIELLHALNDLFFCQFFVIFLFIFTTGLFLLKSLKTK
jgi:hypothetical protein